MPGKLTSVTVWNITAVCFYASIFTVALFVRVRLLRLHSLMCSVPNLFKGRDRDWLFLQESKAIFVVPQTNVLVTCG